MLLTEKQLDMSRPDRTFERLIPAKSLLRTSSYVIIVTYHFMHSLRGYILGITAVCNMLVMYHVEFTTTRRFYTNTISYMHANNLTLIYACW